MNTKHTVAAALLLATAGLAMGQAIAQKAPPGIGRIESLRHDLAPGQEAIQVRVDFAPKAFFGMHSHPGVEIAYVLEGTLEYQLEGQPPKTLKKGESLFIPAGAFHSAKNVDSGGSAELATYLVEKGKPLVVVK